MPRQRSPGGVPSRLYSEVRVKPKCEKKTRMGNKTNIVKGKFEFEKAYQLF